MLSLCKVELKKLWHSTGFWVLLCVFLVSILATFISLSYSPAAMEELLTDTTGLLDNVSREELVDLIRDVGLQENYFRGFYSTTNGTFAVISVGVCIFLLGDFRRGTAQNAVFAGFSKGQIFTSKFVAGMVLALTFLVSLALCNLVVGPVFYKTPLDSANLAYMGRIIVMQALIATEFVAVATAACLLLKNVWAILATALVFFVPAGIPLLIYLGTGNQGASLWFGCMPSFIGISITESFLSLEQRIARPELWSGQASLLTFGACAVFVALSFTLGIRGFSRRDME